MNTTFSTRQKNLQSDSPLYTISGAAQLDSLVSENGHTDVAEFAGMALRQLGITTKCSADDLSRVPATGGIVIVANRPTGSAEGLYLLHTLLGIRNDVRLLATDELAGFAPIDSHVIWQTAGDTTSDAYRATLRQAEEWVVSGGLLVIFPARSAAHLQVRRRRMSDPVWHPETARLIAQTGAPVLPVHFSYRGPAIGLVGGMLSHRLQVFRPRLLLNRRGGALAMQVGTVISRSTMERYQSDADLLTYLRFRTYLLGSRTTARKPNASAKPGDAGMTPIALPMDSTLLEAEIACLPASQKLLETGDRQVFYARYHEIPALMQEIGRLREITFRAVGEGTGMARDLDDYDQWYLQLFVWAPKDRQIVGAYRVGMVDQIMAEHGIDGLYTNSLFKVNPSLYKQLDKSLEMGRSFVQPEYQRSYNSLLLLWKGIGHFIAAHPEYSTLFGAVSVSNDYHGLSRQLLARYLNDHVNDPELSPMVKPKHRLRTQRHGEADPTELIKLAGDLDEISAWIADLEPDHKGVPILIKHYLKLGGRILAMSVDPDFNDALDGLILVDFNRTDTKLLTRYMGKEGLERFQEYTQR